MTDLLDESVLRRLLTAAADAAPAPGRAAEDLLAALTDPDGAAPRTDRPEGRPLAVPIASRPRLSPRMIGAAAAAVLAVAVLAVTLAGADKHTGTTASKAAGSPAASTTSPSPSPGQAFLPAPAPLFGSKAPSGASGPTAGTAGDAALSSPAAAAGGAGGGATPAPSAAPAASPAPQLTDSAKVVKTGSLQLEVRKGGFDGAVAAITTKAIGMGGYVADATTASSSGSPSGTVTVRVPSASFDPLLAQLRALGKVQSVTQKGTDVTAQHTDLQARLSAVTATRDRLNTVLGKASNVQDILAVQDRITEVQTQIEQLQGQIKLLDDQTSMGTLAVSVAEPGAKPPVIANPDDRTIRSAFSEAWHHFGNGLEAVVAWSGSAFAVLLVGLLGLALARLVWTRFRRYLL